MKKLDSLRTLLLAAVPALAADPARLSLYADKGALRAIRSASLSYELGYTLTVWIQDFAGDVDTLFVPVLAWVAANQPDLLDRDAHEPFSFESEQLDATTCDIAIVIELTERVRVERLPNGKLRTTHLDDAPPVDAFPGVPCGTTLWRGLLDDQIAGGEPFAA